MGNTTSMREPHMKGSPEHQHGDVTCTMKHGRKHRHHGTAKHHRTAKHHGKKHHGKKHHGTKHKRSGKKHSGGIGPVSPP